MLNVSRSHVCILLAKAKTMRILDAEYLFNILELIYLFMIYLWHYLRTVALYF